MAYETAIALREAIYEILVARIKGQAPPDAALSLFNGLLARAMSGARLAWGAGELTWSIGREFNALDLLKPIVVSAAELMTGPRAGRVKQCQDDRGCGWLFVDESRAHRAAISVRACPAAPISCPAVEQHPPRRDELQQDIVVADIAAARRCAASGPRARRYRGGFSGRRRLWSCRRLR